MRALTVAILAAAPVLCFAQHAWDSPPPLVWDKMLGNCPASLDWASLRGKVVAISFDDEWLDIEEWNELAQQFRGEPVLFIQIESGSKFLLEQELKKTPYRGCVLLDRESRNVSNFKLEATWRPVVIDQLGAIAGYGQGGIQAADIRALLKHESAAGLSDKPLATRYHAPPADADALPVNTVQITPTAAGEWRVAPYFWDDRYLAKKLPVKWLISDLWETPAAHISFPPDLDEREYNVLARIPGHDRAALLSLVKRAMEERFGLSIEKETQTRRVYLLTAGRGGSAQLQRAQSSEGESNGGGPTSIEGTSRTMAAIAGALEFEAPVIDETGMTGRFNYSASSSLPGMEGAVEMAHQLGLELTPAERPVETLVVRKVR